MLMGLVFAAGLVLLLRFIQPERLLRVESLPDITDFFATLQSPITPLLPSFWAGEALFASLQGALVRDDDRAVIDRLWNPFVAAWYEGGKDDPKLALLRFDAEHAEIWLNEQSLLAGVKMLLGVDPKEDYHDKVAEVNLRG